jgi:hypothetical protein
MTFLYSVQTGIRAYPAPSQWLPATQSPEVKREFKSEWSYISSPPYILACSVIKDRHNFAVLPLTEKLLL